MNLPNEDIVVDNTTNEDTSVSDDTNTEEVNKTEEAGADSGNETDSDSELDIEDIINSLEIEEKTSEEEDIQTEPKFPDSSDKKEEETKEEEQFIDETLLDELDQSFASLESDLNNTKQELDTISQELEEKNQAYKELEDQNARYNDGLDKLGEHPILGPLNEKLLKGEEIDIPKYLEKMSNEAKAALPKMDNIANEPTGVKPPTSLQDKLALKAKQIY